MPEQNLINKGDGRIIETLKVDTEIEQTAGIKVFVGPPLLAIQKCEILNSNNGLSYF